jgi:hypothetical protein
MGKNTIGVTCVLAALVFAVSCGGGSDAPSTSGLPETTKLVDLTDPDWMTLCSWTADVEMAPRTVNCGNGQTVTAHSTADCVAAARPVAACTATVSDYEACAHAFEADPCSALGTSACSWALPCAGL